MSLSLKTNMTPKILDIDINFRKMPWNSMVFWNQLIKINKYVTSMVNLKEQKY